MDHNKTDLTTIFTTASAYTLTSSHLTSFLLIFLERVAKLVTPPPRVSQDQSYKNMHFYENGPGSLRKLNN